MNYACCTDECQPADAMVVCRPALEDSCKDVIMCEYPLIINIIVKQYLSYRKRKN